MVHRGADVPGRYGRVPHRARAHRDHVRAVDRVPRGAAARGARAAHAPDRRLRDDPGGRRASSCSRGTRPGWIAAVLAVERHLHGARGRARSIYRERSVRARQDWLRMPVSGISPEDALAFTAWLAATGRVPGARLCSELEGARRPRRADGRPFPHGGVLTGEHANVDETYGRKEGGFGWTRSGSYPHAASPLGLPRHVGQRPRDRRHASGDQYAMRGGGFFTDAKKTARSPRTGTPQHARVPPLSTSAFRVCADPGPDGDASPGSRALGEGQPLEPRLRALEALAQCRRLRRPRRPRRAPRRRLRSTTAP